MAKKKIALVLAGFVRGIDNINEVNKFIKNNSNNYDFYIFISTYNVIGTKSKTFQSDQNKTEVVNLSTFNNFKYEKMLISNYDDIKDYVKNIIEENFEKLNDILSLNISSKKVVFHNSLCRWHMANIGFGLVKDSGINFDYVIQTRFDLKSSTLDNIIDIEENTIAIHFRRDNSMEKVNDSIFKLNYSGVVADQFYYFNYKDLKKLIEIINVNYIFECYKDKKLKEEFSKVDKLFITNNEFIFHMVFILNNFNFRQIKSFPTVNRNIKWVGDKSFFYKNYF